MNKEFEVHILNEVGIEKANKLAEIFDRALTEVGIIVPPGRHFALVATKMEEASFFAKKGMACRPENQK
jgi:hypothetical protein